MRLIGQLGLLAALVATGYAAFACVAGWSLRHRRVQLSGIVAAVIGATLLTLTTCVLALALLNKDFHFAYVAHYCSRSLPWHYALSALWVGQAGSLLLWAWLCGLLALIFYWTAGHSRSSLRVSTWGDTAASRSSARSGVADDAALADTATPTRRPSSTSHSA